MSLKVGSCTFIVYELLQYRALPLSFIFFCFLQGSKMSIVSAVGLRILMKGRRVCCAVIKVFHY